MSDPAKDEVRVPREVAAEAAIWVTRLHGPHRSAELEREFKRWLNGASLHALAFERSTATWEAVQGISAAAAYRSPAPNRRAQTPRTFAAPMAAFAMLMLVIAVGWQASSRAPEYSTARGEQRTVLLSDGSRVLLNTHTRLVNRETEGKVRLFELEEGEALFEVAKDPTRPFIVTAGPKTITALGTIFSVFRSGASVAVTLVEGRVAVTDSSAPATVPATAVLKPGERLRVGAGEAAKLDMPILDQVFAWKRGEVVFDETPLGEAVDDMNRYGRVQLAIEDLEARALKVSGIFRAGDSEAFAMAVGHVHNLAISHTSDRLGIALRKP